MRDLKYLLEIKTWKYAFKFAFLIVGFGLASVIFVWVSQYTPFSSTKYTHVELVSVLYGAVLGQLALYTYIGWRLSRTTKEKEK